MAKSALKSALKLKDRWILFGVAILYSVLIVWNSSMGPIDDHHLLEPFQWLKFWYNDRFYIFDGIEQFAITQWFGVQPFWYYFINALEFLGLFYCLTRISEIAFRETRYPRLAFWVPILLLFTPGLPTAYLRLFVPERLLALCVSAIVLLDLEGVRDWKRKTIYVLSAVIGFMLKEPTFLVVGGISFFNVLQNKNRKFHLSMMALCATYFGVYLYLTKVASPQTSHYGNTSIAWVVLLVKHSFNYILNDPFVFLAAIPLWFWNVLRNKKLDPYLSIILGYVVILYYLQVYQEYYLLPMLPLLIVAISRHWNALFRPWRWVVIFLFFNSLLYGLGQISIYKNEPEGFSKLMSALVDQSHMSEKRVCYLGVDIESSREILVSSEIHYRARTQQTLTPDFVSTQVTHEGCDFEVDSPYNYAGDTPGVSSKVVFSYQPEIYFPAISIKTWIKYAVSRFGSVPMVNRNIFRDHDFILYRKVNP